MSEGQRTPVVVTPSQKLTSQDTDAKLAEKSQSAIQKGGLNFPKYDHQVDSPLRSQKTRELQHRTDYNFDETNSNNELTLKKIQILSPD